jgi:hypothetical protein
MEWPDLLAKLPRGTDGKVHAVELAPPSKPQIGMHTVAANGTVFVWTGRRWDPTSKRAIDAGNQPADSWTP